MVKEQLSAQPEALPGGENACRPATGSPLVRGRVPPPPPLSELADKLESATGRLTQCLAAAVQTEPHEEAEHCLQDLREVCSSLRGVALLLESMLSEKTAEHKEAFIALVGALGQKMRDASHANRGMVERVSQQIEELGSLSAMEPGEALAARLYDVLVNVRETTGEVGTHIERVAADVESASQQVTCLESQLIEADRRARQDSLTGMSSRLALDLALVDAVGEGLRRGPWCFLLVDVDRFRAVNEALGRVVGDALLCKIARAIERALARAREEWVLGRYGGEEFGVLVHRATILQAGSLGETIRESISSSKWLVRGSADTVLQATVSVGITEYRSGDAVNTVIQRAETALRKAKADGRNRVAVEYPTPERYFATQRAALRGRL